MARHAVYHGPGTVGTMSDISVLKNMDENTQPLARWFTNLCSDDELEGLDDEVPHLWVTDQGGIHGNVDNWEQVFQTQTTAVMMPVPDDGKNGETFEDVVAFIGEDEIIVVNDEEKQDESK